MSAKATEMRCPYCGTTMNHHADKLVYDAAAMAPSAGEYVEEMHSCPACGASASRRESS